MYIGLKIAEENIGSYIIGITYVHNYIDVYRFWLIFHRLSSKKLI